MMDDLGLEDVSFSEESSAQPKETAAATPREPPDSARVSSLPATSYVMTVRFLVSVL